MNFLLKLKAGDYGLAKTYWLYGVIVNIAYRLIDLVVTKFSFELSIVLFFIMAIYTFFQIFGLWNAASRYEGLKIWAVIAKVLAVLGAMLYFLGLFAMLSVLFA